MSRRPMILEGALCALAAIVLVLFSGLSLQKDFERQKRCALERLQKLAVTLIEHSYHMKDDLAIQQVVMALGQAPGIYFACVFGADGKIMAHSQPASVGQTYHRANLPVAAHPLAEGQKKWGTLVFSASEKTERSAWRREMASWTLGGTLVWLAWAARSLIWRRRLAEQEHRIADLLIMAEEQRQKNQHEVERQSQARALWAACLQNAVDQLPEGLVILDLRQRVVSANSTAARLLKTGDEEILCGKPWSEVRVLRSCGISLEQSLRSPGMEVRVDLPTDGVVLTITTQKDGSGTWVRLFPSKRVVE